MVPKPLPKKFEKVWQKWPTFDELRAQNAELKVHQLRTALAPVPCYRCPDQTARYVAEKVTETLLTYAARAEGRAKAANDNERKSANDNDTDEDDDDAESEPGEVELAEPKIYDAMILFRESLRIISEMRRSMNEAQAQSMEPFRLGLALVRENVELLQGRLGHYDEVFDRMLAVTESLMSEQAQRELAKKREENAQEMRKQTFDVAKEYLPTLVKNFRPNAVASAALQAIRSLEPEVVESIATAKDNTPEQREAWLTVYSMLSKAKVPDQPPTEPQDNNHAGAPS